MKKLFKEENTRLILAAIGGAVATILHLEFIIAAIAVIIVVKLNFKKSILKEGAIRILKALVIAIIIVLSLVYHFTFCNKKQDSSNNNVEIITEDTIEESTPVEDQPAEEVAEENVEENRRI